MYIVIETPPTGHLPCASTSAITRAVKLAMQANSNSKMWKIGSLVNVTGKTAYKNTDESAKAVVENYIEKLGAGITNIANEFRPEAIMLSGVVCV